MISFYIYSTFVVSITDGTNAKIYYIRIVDNNRNTDLYIC